MGGGYNIVNHDAFNRDNLTEVGVTKENIPILLNSDWIKKDFKITLDLWNLIFLLDSAVAQK